MLKFAICDDEKEYLQTVEKMIAEYEAVSDKMIEVCSFENPSDLLDSIENGAQYDAYILDIYMPGITGMSLASHLRSININSPLIFLTSSADHAVEAFGVNATHYLLKPYTKEQFFVAMDKAIAQLHISKPENILFKVDDGYHTVSTREILYCETDNNYQQIHLKNGTVLRVRMTASGLYEQLKKYESFCQCGRSYILGLRHIKKLSTDTAVLKNGKVVAVPRSAMQQLRKAYFAYFDSAL